jgi:hypothetical protein
VNFDEHPRNRAGGEPSPRAPGWQKPAQVPGMAQAVHGMQRDQLLRQIVAIEREITAKNRDVLQLRLICQDWRLRDAHQDQLARAEADLARLEADAKALHAAAHPR